MSEAVQDFRAITNDHKVSQQEIHKFLSWGKGDLQTALNYYYRKKDKEIKPGSFSSLDEKTSDAFSKMKNASIKQSKTEQFIKQVREEYQLPIKRPTGSSGTQKPSKNVNEDEMVQEEDSQFAEADYLPEVFSMQPEKVGLQQERERNSLKRMKQEKGKHQQIIGQCEEIEGNSLDYNEIDHRKIEVLENSKTKSLTHKNQNQKLSQVSQNRKKSQAKKESNLGQFGWVSGESEIYLGATILSGFAIKFENNIEIDEGKHIQFRYFIEQDKKKKSFKSKKAEKVMNLRLLHRASEFGRLKDQQVKIFVPLLVHGMIRIQLYSHFVPKRIDYYTALKVNVRVYLLKKAITDPVVETFEGHSDLIVSIYKPVAEQLLGLFERLQIPIKRWPLIKRKSKLKTRNQQPTAVEERKVQEGQTERAKQLQRERRIRNDPFFKRVQKNLTDLIKFSNKEENSNSIKEVKQNESALKKKVLQLKTIDEDKCSQLIDLYEQDLQPYQPAKNFVSSLYNYQALALAWMIQRQGEGLHRSQEEQLHPLWTQYSIADNKSLFVNQLTSQLSLKPPFARSKCLGGILADEMGLGKTVMMAALLSTHKQGKRQKREGANLVIVPLTLLSQWQVQIEKHTKGLKTLIYYAEDRKKYENQLQKFDVVITTYGTASHEYSRGCHVSKLGLFRLKWQRIILDEAHYIKGRIIQTAKAVYELEGGYRWCLTGTPIQNGLADLFSLLHFIRYTPWSEWQCWNKYILKPAEEGEEDVYEVLKTILKRVFLRRTKQSKDHQGKCIVELPPRTSKIQLLQMNPKQREFYDSVYQNSKLKIQELQRLGILQTKYMQVLEILMRLRQICCHPILFKAIHKFTTNLSQFQQDLRRFVSKKSAQYNASNEQRYFEPLLQGEQEQRVQVCSIGSSISQAFLKQTLQKIENKQIQSCVICLNDVQDPVITPCLHIFCKPCSVRQIQQCGICSVCRRRLEKDDVLPLPRENRFNQSLQEGFFLSTKLQALVQHFRKLKPGDKAVVFSQFLGMLDLIEHQLKIQKLTYLRMEGSTTHKERTRIVETFQKDPSVQIFVVSLKTAGVGLNLVAANKVFLVDPWWNPGVEEQAIERVHRIGQKRSVEIIRLIMDKSIQMRMLELNTGKKLLSQKVLSNDSKPSESRVQKLKYLMAKY